MSISHLKITQAGLVALVTTIIGQVVAFVPAFSQDKQVLISAASTVIAAVFLIANAIHALIATKVSGKDLEGDVVATARTEIGKLNVNALVHDAVSGENIGLLVKSELNKILLASGLESKRAEVAAAVPVAAQPVQASPVVDPVAVPVAPVAAPVPLAPVVPPVA